MPSGSCIGGALKCSITGDPVTKVSQHAVFAPGRRLLDLHAGDLPLPYMPDSTYATCLMVTDAQFSDNSAAEGPVRAFSTKDEIGVPLTYTCCGDCGTICYKTVAGWPGAKIVFAGTLDELDSLEHAKALAELWFKYRVGWVASLEKEGTAQCEQFPEIEKGSDCEC